MNTKESGMKHATVMVYGALMAMAIVTGPAFAERAEPVITDRKVAVTAFVDAGQVAKGTLKDGSGESRPLEYTFMNRNGIALTYSGTLNQTLHMNIGVGGLFWKPVPESENPKTKHIAFGPGISEASAQYDFSDRLKLKFGFFGYKYNADAVNLGEYLLRSEAYPNIIHSAGPGGWVWLNSNEYKSMGVRLSWETFGGALRQDLLLFSEFNETPIFDFSPTYVATLKVGKALELGGGISLHRWLPIHPSITTPTTEDNTYIKYNAFPAVQWHADMVVEKANGTLDTVFAAWNAGSTFDRNAYLAAHPELKAVRDVKVTQLGTTAGVREGLIIRNRELNNCLEAFEDQSCDPILKEANQLYVYDEAGEKVKNAAGGDSTLAIQSAEEKHLTFKGVKVMGRASLDLGSLFGMDMKSGSFKLFAEAAVLGIQNQPIFYQKIQERIPMMVGANIPTFGLLDLLSLQMEYFKNPWEDNNRMQFDKALPQAVFPNDNPALYQAHHEDDVKWSIDLQKSLFTGLDLYLQVANDHFRFQDEFAQPSYIPVTNDKQDWYYLVRFQWSM
ncbi:MAG: hypothetical protein ABIW76_06265 [Fibrobacteria bacterium]